MMVVATDPDWKMPDEEKIQNHRHRVVMSLSATKRLDHWGYAEALIDLKTYYSWCEENGIFMEHNILVWGDLDHNSRIMFVFEDTVSAMAFKLRWV